MSPAAVTAEDFWFGSGSPIVTSSGTAGGSGIVWITECPVKACAEKSAELRAYTAVPSSSNPEPFWSEKVGLATKFSRPYAGAGHIYLGNREGRLLAFSGPFTPSTSFLELGSTPPGGQLSGTVTFTATGKQPIEVLAAKGPSPPFTVTGLPAPTTKLTQGQLITVQVTFRAPAPGRFTDSLGIITQLGEYDVGIGGSGVAPAAVPASVGPAPTVAHEPVPRLTKLKARAAASRLRAHRHKRLAVSFNLSMRATVSAAVYRRVISHRCRHGVRRCVRWLPSGVRLRTPGRSGRNLLTVKLGTLAPGHYRLTATPINGEGVHGVTRHIEFQAFH
jgi:hypothetical protein